MNTYSFKFKELDVVRTLISKKATPKGFVGTIVCVFDDPREAYMVEFVDSDGETIDTPIYLPDELEKQ